MELLETYLPVLVSEKDEELDSEASFTSYGTHLFQLERLADLYMAAQQERMSLIISDPSYGVLPGYN